MNYDTIPCKNALTEKNTTVIVGPYTPCPIAIFFNVDNISRFGNVLAMKLNQKCSEGPKITIPYAAILNVLTGS